MNQEERIEEDLVAETLTDLPLASEQAACATAGCDALSLLELAVARLEKGKTGVLIYSGEPG